MSEASPRAGLRVQIARVAGADDLPVPAAATEGAAGLDLSAAVESERVLAPGERALIPTGFRIALPRGYEGQVRSRSGLALRHGVILPNAPGTIDWDYRGELHVILWNTGDEPFTIRRGDRIAQLVVAPVTSVRFEVADGLSETERGDGGFGHTGLAGSEGSETGGLG